MSADSLVSQPYNARTYDRYAYVNNNPIINTDPTGHFPCPTNGYEPGCSDFAGNGDSSAGGEGITYVTSNSGDRSGGSNSGNEGPEGEWASWRGNSGTGNEWLPGVPQFPVKIEAPLGSIPTPVGIAIDPSLKGQVEISGNNSSMKVEIQDKKVCYSFGAHTFCSNGESEDTINLYKNINLTFGTPSAAEVVNGKIMSIALKVVASDLALFSGLTWGSEVSFEIGIRHLTNAEIEAEKTEMKYDVIAAFGLAIGIWAAVLGMPAVAAVGAGAGASKAIQAFSN